MSKRAYPLQWPEGWKRAQYRVNGKFMSDKQWITISRACTRLLDELRRMGIESEEVVISTNVRVGLSGLPRADQPKPSDPGAAVYWMPPQGKTMRCIAIDRYHEVADNLAGIAATLEAMRAVERHGGAEVLERQFLGFAALPEKASAPWREILGIGGAVNLDIVEERFRALAKVHHPDRGGKPGEFEKIQEAREAARVELSA